MTAKHFLATNVICTTLLAANCTQAQGLQPLGLRNTPFTTLSCAGPAQANEIKLIVPFAIPVGVPVAPFAPYFYSYQAIQQIETPSRGSPSAALTTHQSPLTPASPLIATHCAACHGGQSPKASLSFEQIDKLSPENRLKSIRAVVSGRMPIGKKLSPDEVRSLVQEFTDFNHGVAEAQR